jgi:hypothetical protein
MTAPVLLIHGGLWDTMDADGFWRTPGIVAGLDRLVAEMVRFLG